jgi:hypothetical protein
MLNYRILKGNYTLRLVVRLGRYSVVRLSGFHSLRLLDSMTAKLHKALVVLRATNTFSIELPGYR